MRSMIDRATAKGHLEQQIKRTDGELGPDKSGNRTRVRLRLPAQPVDATLSDLEIPYKQVVLSLRTNLASPLQRKRLIFGPFKRPGCQFNTLEKCSVLKFLQAGFARVLRRPIETAPLIGDL